MIHGKFTMLSAENLKKLGWIVIRFTNEDVRENLEGVVLTILAKVPEL